MNINPIHVDRKWCSGCSACMSVCPADAIKMEKDEEGFLYPKINETLCIKCGKCAEVCFHHKNMNCVKDILPECYVYQSENEKVKESSSSGGAFFELGRAFLRMGGAVCGCVFDERLRAIHILSDSLSDLARMQGSKYVQSDMKNCFREISSAVKDGTRVLFSGTPCQCVGLKSFLKESKLPDNMVLTVGIICHGVPSPGLWENYKKWLEKKTDARIIGVNFRDKIKEGYGHPHVKYQMASDKSQEIFHIENGTYENNMCTRDAYMNSFMYDVALRKSCFRCECKGERTDILLGDWYEMCEGSGRMGTSVVSVFSRQGQEFAKASLSGLRKMDYALLKQKNPLAFLSVPECRARDRFIRLVDDAELFDKLEQYLPLRYKVRNKLEQAGLYEIAKKAKDKLKIR